ncbi:MAG: dihydroorotate dehydrogenase-like protein [Calditrichia bacterium]
MADLSTNYLGLELKNPILVSSSTLTQNLEGIKEAAANGAGAVVLRSLFEEVIRSETAGDNEPYSSHPEEYDYLMSELQLQYGAQNYLELIKSAKAAVDIPIIASINCITPKWWVEYAKQIEAAGADALELNLSLMPLDPGKRSADIEQEFIAIVRQARTSVNLPLAVKIGPYFTSLTRFANEICGAGAQALVLFNRFYRFDINLDNETLVGANPYSSEGEMHNSLRWVSALYKRINGQLAANTGIHSGEAVVKQILAGAQVVEVASAIYLNGMGHLKKMLDELQAYMQKKGYAKLDDFRGKLSFREIAEPEIFERLQYIKALTSHNK